jgi:hypothetical protein
MDRRKKTTTIPQFWPESRVRLIKSVKMKASERERLGLEYPWHLEAEVHIVVTIFTLRPCRAADRKSEIASVGQSTYKLPIISNLHEDAS